MSESWNDLWQAAESLKSHLNKLANGLGDREKGFHFCPYDGSDDEILLDLIGDLGTKCRQMNVRCRETSRERLRASLFTGDEYNMCVVYQEWKRWFDDCDRIIKQCESVFEGESMKNKSNSADQAIDPATLSAFLTSQLLKLAERSGTAKRSRIVSLLIQIVRNFSLGYPVPPPAGTIALEDWHLTAQAVSTSIRALEAGWPELEEAIEGIDDEPESYQRLLEILESFERRAPSRGGVLRLVEGQAELVGEEELPSIDVDITALRQVRAYVAERLENQNFFAVRTNERTSTEGSEAADDSPRWECDTTVSWARRLGRTERAITGWAKTSVYCRSAGQGYFEIDTANPKIATMIRKQQEDLKKRGNSA